jgi:hypothetical protein
MGDRMAWCAGQERFVRKRVYQPSGNHPQETTMIVRALIITTALIAITSVARADNPMPFLGTVVVKTTFGYAELVDRLLAAVKANKMGIVARASATNGAKSIGITISGNQVVMVFHPRFAVRMLEASVSAGIEAPLRNRRSGDGRLGHNRLSAGPR